MPKHQPTKLTERFVRSLPFAAKDERGRVLSYVVRDTDVRGLMVVVHSESKSYVLQRDLYAPLRAGQRRQLLGTRRVRLGDAARLLPDEARREARRVIEAMEAGVDPSAPPPAPEPSMPPGQTLRAAWERYLERCQRKGRAQGTIDGYQYLLDNYLSDWLERPLRDIGTDRLGVDDRHRALTKNSGPYTANHAMRALRAIYRHALRKDPTLPPPPTDAVDFNEERPRQEVVTDWPAWRASVEALTNPVTRDWYMFVALTGMRREASCAAAVTHLNTDVGFLHVPKPKGGTRRAFDLPLSEYLGAMLKARVEENRSVFGADCRWVFPSHFSVAGHLTEPEVTGLPSPHVLRHSYATAASAAGLSELDIKLLLNHKLPGVTGGYIHGTALGEHLRACQQKVTAYLLARMQPAKGNVVPLRAA